MPTSFPIPRLDRLRPWLLHAYRWSVLVLIVWLIHHQHQWYRAQQQGQRQAAVTVERLRGFYPQAAKLADYRPGQGGQTVVDGDGKPLGFVVRTSPASDSIIGYSGPSNTLVAFDTEGQILGIDILDSGDTREHLQAVRMDELFMTSFNGMTWEEAGRRQRIDGASGATLTSLAIAEGIVRRLGGSPHSTRFPEPLALRDVRPFFPEASELAVRQDKPGLHDVLDAGGLQLGSVFRTSPTADNQIGFQGPTDTLVALDADDRVCGIAVLGSYETPEYVGYIRDDDYFLEFFNGQTLADLAELDLVQAGVEGVSGATMTSQTMARGMAAAAARLHAIRPQLAPPALVVRARDAGTAALVVLATLLAFTRLRGQRWLRVVFQVVLIVYLGFINGDMVSQALGMGWAQSGVPWRLAPGLVLLVAAALLAPLATRRQLYCHHICPHGAAQQLLKGVLPYKLHLGRRLTAALAMIPALLLGIVLAVGMLHLPLNLAGIEPFDAYVFRVAGWATITVAVVGLAFSLVVPMGYCRFGCPTGAVLGYLRLQGRGDRFGRRDVAALVLCLAAALLAWQG